MNTFILKSALIAATLSLAVPGLALARDASPQYSQPAERYEDDRYQEQDRRHREPVDSDHAIHERVHDALESEMGNNARGIVVSVHRGVVTLKGEVSSERIRQDAHAIAHDIEGVRSVKYSKLVARRYASRYN